MSKRIGYKAKITARYPHAYVFDSAQRRGNNQEPWVVMSHAEPHLALILGAGMSAYAAWQDAFMRITGAKEKIGNEAAGLSNLTLRVPKSLHAAISRLSDAEGISINGWVIRALEAGLRNT